MTFKNRWLGLGAIAILVLVLLSLFAAPRTPSLRQGSTYSRSPDGYGAWFAYMQSQGKPVQRWQKPIDQLLPSASDPPATEVSHSGSLLAAPRSPITFIQIDNGTGGLGIWNEDWIRQGNRLVLVGVRAPVMQAPFRSNLESPAGSVTVETSRRLIPGQLPEQLPQQGEIRLRLSDSYGAVAWEKRWGQGSVIFISTPHLAANAYQAQPGNFKFLAQLVTEPGDPIWVDEYLHGYKDQDIVTQETSQSLLRYLSNTPLVLVAVQAIAILLVLIWAQNRRFGPPMPVIEPKPDNSAAYIQALAGVLQKANCGDFVVDTVGKAEQLHIQRSLGLGRDLLDPQTVIAAWQQQTGRPAQELQELLNWKGDRRPSEQELLTWLKQIQAIRPHLPR